jgi:hypothetical protein
MTSKQAEPCREFRHVDGDKHSCHRDNRHCGEHHADSGLRWGRNAHARSTRMAGDPCPDREPVQRSNAALQR